MIALGDVCSLSPCLIRALRRAERAASVRLTKWKVVAPERRSWTCAGTWTFSERGAVDGPVVAPPRQRPPRRGTCLLSALGNEYRFQLTALTSGDRALCTLTVCLQGSPAGFATRATSKTAIRRIRRRWRLLKKGYDSGNQTCFLASRSAKCASRYNFSEQSLLVSLCVNVGGQELEKTAL